MTSAADLEIDARGLVCPAPVIELARGAKTLGHGTVDVLADDPAALSDIPAWCTMKGARLVSVTNEPDHARFRIEIDY